MEGLDESLRTLDGVWASGLPNRSNLTCWLPPKHSCPHPSSLHLSRWGLSASQEPDFVAGFGDKAHDIGGHPI